MKDYEFLGHTSEAKLRAFGPTPEQRFVNAARGMTDLMFELDKVQPKARKQIVIKGRDMRSLLHNWLEEFVLLLDAELFVLCRVEKIKITKTKETLTLEAIIFGQKADDALPRRGAAVKAVTYDEMEVADDHVQVVFDV